MTFDTLVTGVRAFECAFNVRRSSFVHGLITRRAVFAGFAVVPLFMVFFIALGISHILLLNGAHIVALRGENKADISVATCGMMYANASTRLWRLTHMAMKKI
jgi:hypothetical protein